MEKKKYFAEANPVPRMLMTVEEQNRVSQIQPQVKKYCHFVYYAMDT